PYTTLFRSDTPAVLRGRRARCRAAAESNGPSPPRAGGAVDAAGERERPGPLIVSRAAFIRWAILGSNQCPLRCERSALPLSESLGRRKKITPCQGTPMTSG